MRIFIARGLLFLLLLPFVTYGFFVAANRIPFGKRSLYDATSLDQWRPGKDASLLRFREVEEYGDVDVLLVGSSHAYRGFDTRIFARHGIRSFNIGSTSQSPLNTHYVLQRYLDAVTPELVVYEIYCGVLGDGTEVESACDLMANTSFSTHWLRMVLATRSLFALRASLRTYLERTTFDFSEVTTGRGLRSDYVSGGYVVSHTQREETVVGDEARRDMVFSGRARRYLGKTLRMLRKRGIPVILVTQPLPPEYIAELPAYETIRESIRELAARHGVRYVDFNEELVLDSREHFMDYHHLNIMGVEVFNEALCVLLLRQYGDVLRPPPTAGQQLLED
jgi:hypothetical protein